MGSEESWHEVNDIRRFSGLEALARHFNQHFSNIPFPAAYPCGRSRPLFVVATVMGFLWTIVAAQDYVSLEISKCECRCPQIQLYEAVLSFESCKFLPI